MSACLLHLTGIVWRERGDRGRLAYNHYIRLFVCLEPFISVLSSAFFTKKTPLFPPQSATLNVKQVVQLMYKSAILAHLIHQNWRIKSPHLVALVSIWTYAQRERRTIISRYSLSPLSLSYFSSVQIFIVDCGGAVTAATNYILHVFVFAFSSLDQHFGKQRYIYQETVFI